jgi:hypothetical protein
MWIDDYKNTESLQGVLPAKFNPEVPEELYDSFPEDGSQLDIQQMDEIAERYELLLKIGHLTNLHERIFLTLKEQFGDNPMWTKKYFKQILASIEEYPLAETYFTKGVDAYISFILRRCITIYSLDQAIESKSYLSDQSTES